MALTPWASRKRLVSDGNSVEMRTPSGRSAADRHGELSGTASTTRTGREVALEYCSSPSETTLAPVSSIQSRPVMPTSNSPRSRYDGISCGRRNRTLSIRGSSIDA